jgi:hypothetical protein
MAIDNTPIEGDDYRWKVKAEQKIKALESRIARLELRIRYMEKKGR